MLLLLQAVCVSVNDIARALVMHENTALLLKMCHPHFSEAKMMSDYEHKKLFIANLF